MRKPLKILSLILSVVLFMGVFSAANPALAAEVQLNDAEKVAQEEAAELVTSETEAESDEAEEPTLLYEDESRRDEYTKHFVMSDGTVNAVMYPEPVHYKGDENEKWEEIDNTLEYDKAEGKFKNKANKFKVEFDKDLSADEMLTIENEGYTLSWKYKAGLFRGAMVNGKVEKAEEPQSYEKKAAHKTRSKFKFNSFESESDLEYVVTSTGIKENIILKSKDAKNSYTFVVDADGLTLTKKEDGSISAVNENEEEIFLIPAPFMYDSNNVYSYDVEYNLSEKNNGKYEITVVADEAWLQAEERAYPVVVDPVITTKQKKSAIATTFVASGYASTNMNNMQDLYIGVESANYKKCRTLVKFALPSLNKGDMVVQASLAFYMHSVSFYTSSMPDKEINVHKITENWDASTVKWNNQPTYDSVVTDYNFIERNPYEWKYFDVTKTVKEWYEGKASNYGFLIKSAVETGDNADVAARGIFWSDKYNSVDEGYPVVIISYRNNKGLESYNSYSTYGVDTAGTVSIDNYTGNMVYNVPILSGNGEVMPLNLSAYYNTYCSKEKLAPGDTYSTTPGQGFRLNVQETILPSSEYGLTGDAKEDYPYVYTDGDGTEHYIAKVTEDGKTTYEDEDGLGLKLTFNGDIYTYKLTAKDGSYRLFNAKGNLFRISDNNGKYITIHYVADEDSKYYKKRITHIIDGSGNRYDFTYHVVDGEESFYIHTIKDNNNRTVVFTVSGKLLRQIQYYDNTTTQIVYEFADKFETQIAQGLINYIQSNDGYRLNFDYNEIARGGRVKKLKEFGADAQKGQIITFDRTEYNTTVIRSAGMDGVHVEEDTTKGDDDIITTLQFDNVGRATSQQLKFGSGIKIGAGSVEYTSSGASTGLKNRVLSSSSVGRNVVNLVKGGNCENTDAWAQSETSGNVITTSRNVTSAQAYMGKKSLFVNNTYIKEGTNANSYFRQTITGISKNTNYTLSAYIKAENIEIINEAVASGAYVQINEYASNGDTIKTAHSDVITFATDEQVNKGWRRVSVTLKTAENVDNLKIYLCLRNATGKAYFDCVQLEKSGSANTYNMLQNSSFEKYTSNKFDNWTYVNMAHTVSNSVVRDGRSNVTKVVDTYSAIIDGNALKAKGMTQTVAVAGEANDTYIISGWGAGNSVNSTFHKKGKNDESGAEDALFEIAVRVNYNSYNSSGALLSSEVEQYKKAAKFNTTISGWQYAVSAFSLKYTGGEKGVTYVPKSITVVPRFTYQANHVYFDNIMLAKEASQSYTYDKKGNLVSTADPEQQVNMDYDEDTDNLMSYTDTAGYKTHLQYDSKKNLVGTNTPNGVKTENTYSGSKIESVEVHNGSLYANKGKEGYTPATMGMKTTYEYYGEDSSVMPDDTAYLKKVKDQMGYETTYGYDKYGNRTTVTDNAGRTTTSTYNSIGTCVEKVSSGDSEVAYNFTAGSNRLSSIVFGNINSGSAVETYNFAYDKFGNTISTSVGAGEAAKPLSTNSYAPYNGALLSTTYGNGDVINYGYDNLGNRISLSRGDTQAFGWKYSASGTPVAHTDNINNTKYSYTYDSLGRLIRQDISDLTTNKGIGVTEYGFDKRGNLNKLTNSYGGRTYTQGYSYSTREESANSAKYTKDNLPTLYIYSANRNVVYEYDTIDRLNTRKLTTDSPIYFDYIYKLSNRNEAGKDYYRTTLLHTEIIKDTSYRYSYDDAGNIAKVEKGARKNANSSDDACEKYVDYVSYEYDNLNQLTRENSVSKGLVSDWTYDEQGNILTRKEYVRNTDDTAGALSKTVTYNYSKDSDAGWNNLLTSVTTTDSTGTTQQFIDYDAIGNPTSYLGANLSWFGRQLNSYIIPDDTETTDVNESLNVSYTYDADGLRTSKTVDGATTTYQYVGDKLYYLCAKDADGNTSYEMYFFYDSYDKLTVLKYFLHTVEDENNVVKEFTYYVATNYFGDVVGLYDGEGNILNSYEYDAWGNVIGVYKHEHSTDDEGKPVISTVENTDLNSIAHRNPIRYRSYCYDTETGLYYLQSRYYNPEIGRFLNADGLLNGNGDILGYNMFAYCSNNPVMFSDANGCGFLKNIIKVLVKKIVQPSVNLLRANLSEKNMTYSSGYSITGTPSAITYSAQIGMSFDTNGNIALQKSVASGFTSGTPGVSFMKFESFTNASSIYKLDGFGYQIGGGLAAPVCGVPLAVSADILLIPDKELNSMYYGFSRSVGVGTPGKESHIELGYTETTSISFNVFDIVDEWCGKIMEW